MKKNLRLVSVAAAALLAVAPVATSVVPTVGANVVQAADNGFSISTAPSTGSNAGTTETTKPTNRAYFTYNGDVIGEAGSTGNGNVVRKQVNITVGERLSKVQSDIESGLKYFSNNNSNGVDVKLDGTTLRQNLATYGVIANNNNKDKNDKYYYIKQVPSTSFNLSISNGGATIQIPVVTTAGSTSENTNAPVFKWTSNNQAQKENLNGQVFQVAVGSNFNPTNFTDSEGNNISITANQNSNNTTAASITSSGSVDTSAAGRYYKVTLTATGLTGEKTTVTYTVLVAPSSLQTLHAASGQTTIPTYNIYGNNVLSGSTTYKDGQKVYVGDQARTINGVSYSRVSTTSKNDANSSNTWVLTSALVTPTTPSTPSDTNTQTETVMVDSRAYDKSGNYLGHMYYAYDSIEIVPTVVTINGKTYYKVANKDEYVRVTNITGNQRTLKHNAYIYWSSYRRTPGTGKMYRGQTVTTYGGQMRFKNGKKYYRIEGCRNNNKRYIKAVNFY